MERCAVTLRHDVPTNDPIRREIVQNALTTLADETGIAAARSAYSVFVNQSASIASALFDHRGRLMAQPRRGLFHNSAVRMLLRSLFEDWPTEQMEEGDVFIGNDPFRGGIHATDVMVARPIFIDGELQYFHAAMMIVSDLGGTSAQGLSATSTECFHEGLMIPTVHLMRRGEFNADVVRMIGANSRTPRRVMGDIRALAGAGHVAARRLAELTVKYGPGTIPSVLDDLFDRSEALVRRRWAAIPDGTYYGAYSVEEDGVVPDQQHWVRVAVTVDGDRLLVDLSETDPQARGPINSSSSQTLCGILHALLFYVDRDVPINEGLFRSFDVELPLGSLVNPEFPAACNNRMGTVEALVDSINMALAPVCPETVRAPAAAAQTFIVAPTKGGSGEAWVFLEARFGPDGARSTMDANDCLPNATYGTPTAYGANIEVVEGEAPVRCDRFEVWPNSGGPGKWRGGASFEREVTVLEDVMLTTRAVDRCRIPPQGLAGGKPGRGGAFIVDRGRPTEWRPALRQTNALVPAGSTITMQISGGGGYGDPFERDVAAVQDDVRAGYVSVEGARRDYGVVLDPVTVEVDDLGTSELRGSDGTENGG